MINVVLPFFSTSIACWMISSVSVSIFDVASSNMRIAGSNANALAKETSCLCPEDRVLPFSITGSSNPFSKFFRTRSPPTACKAASTFSRVMRGSFKLTLDSIVPENKYGS